MKSNVFIRHLGPRLFQVRGLFVWFSIVSATVRRKKCGVSAIIRRKKCGVSAIIRQKKCGVPVIIRRKKCGIP